MHDIRLIRDDPETFDAGLVRRGAEPASQEILKLDKEKRDHQQIVESARAERKRRAAEYAIAKARGAGEDELSHLTLRSVKIGSAVETHEILVRISEEKQKDILASLPNLPAIDVPDGESEADNVMVKVDGRPTHALVRDHTDLASSLGLDFESAAAIAGTRFAVLKGGIARLHRALGQFMLDHATRTMGYLEIIPPLLVRDTALFGTAQLPKFADDLFRTSDDRWLIPTAEVSLTNLVREKILEEKILPLRFAALTQCFRAEAGAAGRDTRGLIRQHQFEKVELVSITTPNTSDAEHERMTAAAESILEALSLPYRRMLLCAGDMGFSARKTFDLEVWLPGQAQYREISSCSNCGDFQARRMNARFRREGGKPEFVHTLNGSALAVGRTLVAVLETYQRADGSVEIPAALHAYTGGLTVLEPA